MDAALNKLLRSSKKRDAVLLAFVTDNSPGQVALPSRILKDTSVDSMVARNDVVTTKLSTRRGDDGDVLMRMHPLPEGASPPVAYVLKGGALCEVVGVTNALTPSTVHAALSRATRKPTTRKRSSPTKAAAEPKQAARRKAQAASPHRAATGGRGRSAPSGTTKASSARIQARVRGKPAFPLTFRPSDTLATVYRRIQEHLATEGPNGPYTLSDGTVVPHKLFGPQDYYRTLEQLGLTNAAVVANDASEPPIPELASEHDIKPAGGIMGYVGSWVSWAFGGGTPAPAPAPAPTHSNAARRPGNQRDSRDGDATSVVHRPGFGRNVHGLAHRGDDDGDKNEFFGGDSTMFQGRPDE